MNSNPILEELWQIKDQLAAEAGYDIDRFCDNLQQWIDEHPHNGPVVRDSAELKQIIAEQERQRILQATLALNDQTSEPDKR